MHFVIPRVCIYRVQHLRISFHYQGTSVIGGKKESPEEMKEYEKLHETSALQLLRKQMLKQEELMQI
jgi:hypothetical protein